MLRILFLLSVAAIFSCADPYPDTLALTYGQNWDTSTADGKLRGLTDSQGRSGAVTLGWDLNTSRHDAYAQLANFHEEMVALRAAMMYQPETPKVKPVAPETPPVVIEHPATPGGTDTNAPALFIGTSAAAIAAALAPFVKAMVKSFMENRAKDSATPVEPT
jgi:hypothetical protein